jgi:serine protease Do
MRLAAPVQRIGLICALALAASCSRSGNSLPDFADLVEQVSPSVVNISAVSAPPADEQAGDDSQNQGQVPDWLKKFLDKHGKDQGGGADNGGGSGGQGENPDDQGGDNGAEQSLGSGFILSEDGYILTNQHVVSDAKEVTVRLFDHRQLPAQVIGSDERADIALLKIDAKGLPAVKLADMRKTRVGEWVLAIGSPFNFDYSVTAGIISAKGRNLDTEQYVPFIQTDAAINPGNSGGPLFNLKGEVVGVNSQIYSQTGGFMGVAFAIPIDIAYKVAKELKEHGKVTRGWLGVVVQEVDLNLAKSFNLPKPEGALVARVLPDSPAQQAGIKAGDVLMRYNGVELVNSRSLPPLVGDSSPGDTVNLELLRDGRSITIKVEIGTLDTQDQADQDSGAPPPDKPKAPPQPNKAPGDSGSLLGLTVQDLSADERSKAKVISGGVRVSAVGPGAGREAGVQGGDVILSISGQEVDSAARYREVVGRLTPGQTVPMLVQRQGSPLFLAIQVPGKG